MQAYITLEKTTKREDQNKQTETKENENFNGVKRMG
jgi:hypothetical protein